jgi:acetyl-CoA carboxylase carboxyl transferase subunit beta
MSWLRNITKPGIFTRSKKDVRANVWVKCPSCGDMLYKNDLEANLYVCTNCDHHLRIPVAARLDYLVDVDSVQEISVKAPKVDPLKFKDRKAYADRLKDAKKATNGDDAFKVVTAQIHGVDVVICVLDFAFMAGSMGTYVGEAIVKAAETAKEKGFPLILVPASGGARMQEGILSLMQMARTTAAILDLKDDNLPYLVLLTDPTTGGVTASFAMQGDILMAEPGALIGFAGPRVIQQTIGETLPEGFQTAEYLKDHGMVDMVTSRHDQKQEIANIFSILLKK